MVRKATEDYAASRMFPETLPALPDDDSMLPVSREVI
jgi:hypothetical protein